LLLYQSLDIVERRFEQRHETKIDPESAREIASYITQAHQWFSSAKLAGGLVRPLALYYGVLALSRSLILFISPRENNLDKAHGLRNIDWGHSESANDTLVRDALSLRFNISRGTFSQLAAVTENVERAEVVKLSSVYPELTGIEGSSRSVVRWYSRGSTKFTKNQSLSFGDIISRLPDLAGTFEATRDARSSCYPVAIALIEHGTNLGLPPSIDYSRIDLGRIGLSIPSLVDVIKELGIPENQLEVISEETGSRIQTKLHHNSVKGLMETLPPIRTDILGRNFFVTPFPGQIVLSSLTTLFATAWVLGSIVRYYPTDWIQLTTIQKGDSSFPLLRAAIDLVETRYPLEVLDLFERQWPSDALSNQSHLGSDSPDDTNAVYLELTF
jgi:hypothetical protein